jgi:uncharacterized membrane protein
VDISAFYAVLAGVNFTLLGLWWVTVQERREFRARGSWAGRMAYVVSLQFLLPGTMSLVSQVAPDVPLIWRTTFALGGAAGVLGIVLLVPLLLRTHLRRSAVLLLVVGIPIHVAVTLVALAPDLRRTAGIELTNLQIEAIVLCLLVLLGAHTAWTAAMTPTVHDARTEQAVG